MEIRTKAFAVSIIRLSGTLPKTTESAVIRKQITKSGTSIGANYREANRSRSKAEFKSKIRLCESEAAETLYWLDIAIDALGIHKDTVSTIYNECKELLAIFTAAAKKL
ncbi:MAG: four helix bundle protein [Desulfobacteraceae bacterium]|nr:four helix bundle protein [Desulfobacteraceae bacterium]